MTWQYTQKYKLNNKSRTKCQKLNTKTFYTVKLPLGNALSQNKILLDFQKKKKKILCHYVNFKYIPTSCRRNLFQQSHMYNVARIGGDRVYFNDIFQVQSSNQKTWNWEKLKFLMNKFEKLKISGRVDLPFSSKLQIYHHVFITGTPEFLCSQKSIWKKKKKKSQADRFTSWSNGSLVI